MERIWQNASDCSLCNKDTETSPVIKIQKHLKKYVFLLVSHYQIKSHTSWACWCIPIILVLKG